MDTAIKREVLFALEKAFPQCFSVRESRRRPLKVGIFHDIVAEIGDAISHKELSGALRFYTAAWSYQRKLKVGRTRIDLNGKPAGYVSSDEAFHAHVLLECQREREERKKKEERERKQEVKREEKAAKLRDSIAGLKQAYQARREMAS
jgi:ProP effector